MMLFRFLCPVNTSTKRKEKESTSSSCRPLVRVVCMSCKNLVISSVSLVRVKYSTVIRVTI